MGGRKINDHSFWAGGSSKESVLPKETKTMSISDVEGGGDLMRYEDTEKEISSMQRENVSKAERQNQKAGYRN
jgi:hypothetical protein